MRMHRAEGNPSLSLNTMQKSENLVTFRWQVVGEDGDQRDWKGVYSLVG